MMQRSLVFFFLAANSAFAGWTSGGGSIDHSAGNPWFLSNTKTVTYCIKLDTKHISVSKKKINENILKSLAYWKRQFSDAYKYGHKTDGNIQTPIATQKFIYQPCDKMKLKTALKKRDLVFQFGVLTKEQRKYLVDPTKFIAIAVRTEYDEVHLRGKGFIYFSADSGKLRYQGKGLLDRAWSASNHLALFKIISHELGHVFGLPHHGSFLDLMATEYPLMLLRKNLHSRVIGLKIPNQFSHYYGQLRDPWPPYKSVCRLTSFKAMKKFFEIPANHNCFEFFISPKVFKVFSKERQSDSLQLIGEAKLASFRKTILKHRSRIGFTDKQVFFPHPYNKFNITNASFSVRHKYSGEYLSKSGKKKGMILTMEPFDLEISGVEDGKIIIDLFDMVSKNKGLYTSAEGGGLASSSTH